MNKKFAIILGEPNSINSEIIFKIWKKNKKKFKNIFLIGNIKLLKKQLKILKIKNIKFKEIKSLYNINSTKYFNILNINLDFQHCFNVKKKDSSIFIKKCFDTAHNFAIKKEIKGFINCPIDKSRFLNNSTPGITEYLSRKNNIFNKEAMVIFNKKLSVSPVTTHIKINQVARKVTKNIIINKVRVLNKNLNKILKKKN